MKKVKSLCLLTYKANDLQQLTLQTVNHVYLNGKFQVVKLIRCPNPQFVSPTLLKMWL